MWDLIPSAVAVGSALVPHKENSWLTPVLVVSNKVNS